MRMREERLRWRVLPRRTRRTVSLVSHCRPTAHASHTHAGLCMSLAESARRRVGRDLGPLEVDARVIGCEKANEGINQEVVEGS